MQPLEFLTAFIEPLEKAGISYFITGSVASIFYGEPRLTHAIDLVLHLSEADIKRFPSLFPLEKYYCPPEEVLRIENKRESFGHFNLIHHASGLKADIYLDADDVLHRWAFQHRKRAELGTGLSIWLAPPEYVILRKLEYFREGGSEKHLQDIRKMLPQVEASLDRAHLETEIKARGLQGIWQKI